MNESQIDRINFLARKSRSQGLTQEEKDEQQRLRAEYVRAFKSNLVSQLESITVLEKDGTKHKLEKSKKDSQRD